MPASWYEAAPKLGELMRAVTQPWEYSRGAPSIKPAIPRTNTNNLLFFNFIFGRAVFAVFLPSHNRFGMKRCLAGANRRKQVAITYQACGRRKTRHLPMKKVSGPPSAARTEMHHGR